MLVKLLRVQELPEGARVHKEVYGRTVTILRHQGKVYALDSACFHQGGPIGTQGEIEEISGVTCLRCPWHNYRVSLSSGAHVQKDLQGNPCERHGKQRTHNVYDGGDGHLWVDINIECKPAAASDVYNMQLNQGGLDSQGFGLSQNASQHGLSLSQSSCQTGLDFSSSQTSCQTAASIESDSSEEMMETASTPSTDNIVSWGIEPFAGVGKRPFVSPASSPVKQKPKVTEIMASAASTAAPQTSIAFKGRRSGTSNVRRKLATNAVMQNYKPPPIAPGAARPPMQRTINDFFQKQADSPQAEGVTGMQIG